MSPRNAVLGFEKWGKSSPKKTFQLRSQFCGVFAIIHVSSFLVGVRTSYYSEDHPRRTIFSQNRAGPRKGSVALEKIGAKIDAAYEV